MKKIFISYSHEDAEFKDKLVKQLDVLNLAGICTTWEDGRIQAGTDWNEEIKKAIEEADVAVLMVSEGFLNSKFIKEYEVPLILERKEKGGLTVLPLIVKPCDWKNIPWLAKIQWFPPGGKILSQCIKDEQQEILLQFAGTIASYTKISTPGTVTLFTPLPPRKIKLIGREKDLAALAEMLKKSERVVLVNGLGGIGKTEVCKSFFYTHYDRYVYAAWIDWISSLKESLVHALGGDDSGFIQPGEKDTMDERFKKIIARLRQMKESFLLVVDNIENPQDADLDALASLPAQVKVLVNSRSFIEGYEERCLDYLSPGECRALFYEFYKGKVDDEAVDRIVELCGYHTLTVELLAKTAHHAAMTILSLYETLKSKGFNLNEVAGEKVATTWHNEKEKKRFFDHLVKVFDISGLTEEELSILVNMSVLPAVYIPMEWVREWLKLTDNNPVVSLVEKGWLKRDEETRLYLHPVMQEVVRYRVRRDAQKCKVLILSLVNVLNLDPGDNPIMKKKYILYGESVVRALAMDQEEKDEALAALANNLSIIYRHMGSLKKSFEFQLKALNIREQRLDRNHPDLSDSYNNLSLIYQDLGQPEKALELQLKVLVIKEKVLYKSHPNLATSYTSLAGTYLALGQSEKALEFQLKALKIFEQALVKNHPHLATCYNNLAEIYRSLGQLEKALEFQLKALSIMEQVLDKNHPNLAASYNNLSLIYQAMGQLEKALEFQLKALSIMEQVLDKNDPNLATSYNNLSLIYQAKGQPEKALEFQLKDKVILEQMLDKNYPALASSYSNLSMIYKAMGQFDLALEFQLKALEIKEEVLDKNHPSLATSYNNVSTIYKAMGQLDLALEFQLKALAIREALLAKNHPDLATSYNNVSTIYRDMGQLDQALEFHLKANEIYEAVLDKHHPLRATSYNNVSLIYQAMGQLDRALEYQLKDIEISEKILAINHPILATSYHNLSTIYRDMKDYASALKYAQKAVAILQFNFPNGHPNLDKAKRNLEVLKKIE